MSLTDRMYGVVILYICFNQTHIWHRADFEERVSIDREIEKTIKSASRELDNNVTKEELS
jgi:hypothetical protein